MIACFQVSGKSAGMAAIEFDPERVQRLPPLELQARQQGDPVARLSRRAVSPKVAAIGSRAMSARLDRRRRLLLQAGPHGRELGQEILSAAGDQLAHILPREERGPFHLAHAADVGVVDVQHLGRAHGDAGALEHVQLQRDVVEIVVLHLGAALDLPQPPAVGETLQHVDADADVVVCEGRLEDRRHRRIAHQHGGAGDGFSVLPRLVGDQHAAREQLVGVPADLVAHGQRRSGGRLLVGLGLVHDQPQAPQALQAGHGAGFGKVRAGQRRTVQRSVIRQGACAGSPPQSTPEPGTSASDVSEALSRFGGIARRPAPP